MKNKYVKYIADAEEMRRADENTIRYFGVPQLVLMERAALFTRDFLLQKWQGLFAKAPRILIAVGNGNNGGDGVALARLFFLMGYKVTVLVNGDAENDSDALKTQMAILEKYAEKKQETAQGQSLHIVTDNAWKREIWQDTRAYDLIVDALFGIGLSRPITGIYREKIEWLNGLEGKKVALDIPSGVSAQDGSVLSCAFCADVTITFGFLKRGMLLYPGKGLCGEVKVADIGITKESFLSNYPAGLTIDRRDIKKQENAAKENGEGIGFLTDRRADGNKGSFGKVLLLAGSVDAPGAALLAGEAAFRSGAGMLKLVSSLENREAVITKLPEAMYQMLCEDTDWERALAWCDSVVLGPGIGQERLAKESVEKILTLMQKSGLQRPLVIDADGLNLIASSGQLAELMKQYAISGGIVIITPHMAEFARLLHCSIQELQAERMEKIRRYAQEMGVIVVCKDAATVVGYTEEADRFRYYINQTGNSGMATAGSGDILSGVIGALTALVSAHQKEKREDAAQKTAYFEAAYQAVYLHGLAGDRAALKYGEVSMKAGDILGALPEIFSK